MRTMKQMALAFWNDEDGATAIEYGLIAALIAVVIIAAVASTGTRLSCIFQRVADCMVGSSNGTCTTACT
jgi:pilus assembly protein Flp/PilA